MTNYATLFGFGLFDTSDPKYKGYLDRFAALIKKKKIDVAILCGGHTNLNFPDKSEAGTMADYLRTVLREGVKIVIEDRSRTTPEHFQFTKELIDFSPQNKVFIVSDSTRFFKVYWMMLHYWFGLSKEQVLAEWLNVAKQLYSNPKKKAIDIELRDMRRFLAYKNAKIVIDSLHKGYKEALHQLISEVFEIEGLYDSKVMDLFLEQAKAKEDARAKYGLK